jgi:hypothetical protein
MTRRGGVLLEVLLALTLFVGGALAVLRATSQARRSVVEAGTLQRAVDLATTRMAELEAGLISDADLREGGGMPRPEFGAFEAAPATNRLRIEVATRRSPYAGLTLVELDVLDPDQIAVDGGARVVFSLRKLVQLRDQPVDEYELDDMLEGLPDRPEAMGGEAR